MANGEEDEEEEQKEYVLMEFEDGWLPNTNTRFSLTGLDTLHPTLELEDGITMVGHYEDTVGTCILFSEHDEERLKLNDEHKLKRKELTVDPNPLFVRSFSKDDQSKHKEVEPVCSLQKKLKFRVVENDEPAKKYDV